MSKVTLPAAASPRDADVQPTSGASREFTGAPASRLRRIYTLLTSSPRIWIPIMFLTIVGVISLAAPLIVPHNPTQLLDMPLLPPSSTYWLGTDDFGRDELSRLIYAGRVSLGVSASAVVIAATFGVMLGIVAGYYRGIADFIIMRSVDMLLSFPTIVLAIAMVAFLGNSIRNIIIAIALVYVPRFVRVVYGSTLTIRNAEFVEAARVVGASGFHIMRTAILPNVAAPIFVQFSLSLGFAILVESGLSFLGLGAQPPTPSWGNMISAARPFIDQPHLLIAPSLMIGLTILALNTLGDGLRDALDPRLHGSR